MTRGDSNFENNGRTEESFKEWDNNDVLDDELSLKSGGSWFMVCLFMIFIIILLYKCW